MKFDMIFFDDQKINLFSEKNSKYEKINDEETKRNLLIIRFAGVIYSNIKKINKLVKTINMKILTSLVIFVFK